MRAEIDIERIIKKKNLENSNIEKKGLKSKSK
jgi:hypothetical protein